MHNLLVTPRLDEVEGDELRFLRLETEFEQLGTAEKDYMDGTGYQDAGSPGTGYYSASGCVAIRNRSPPALLAMSRIWTTLLRGTSRSALSTMSRLESSTSIE